MKILFQSDLHLEHREYKIPAGDDEKNTIVVFCGDVAPIPQIERGDHTVFLDDVCNRFKHIIWVLGNHEFYGSDFSTGRTTLRSVTSHYKNLDIIEKETLIIDGVAFIGATLWTDMDNMSRSTMARAERHMNDYRMTTNIAANNGIPIKLKVLDTINDHILAKAFIFDEITKQKNAGNKTVVVTHHLPALSSVPAMYKCDKLNGAFTTELSNEIITTEANIWNHGHTHHACDYYLGNTRILCNPRGYPGEISCMFNPVLVVDI